MLPLVTHTQGSKACKGLHEAKSFCPGEQDAIHDESRFDPDQVEEELVDSKH